MKYLFAVLALLCLAAATTSRTDDGWPPKPYTADTVVSVTLVSTYAALEAHCGKATPGFHINGCYVHAEKMIYLPNPNAQITKYHDYRSEDFARLFAHEVGHTEGWAGDHPRP